MSGRTQQVAGMFDIPEMLRDEREWTVDLPIETRPWNIGLLVGPSGTGKTTLLTELFHAPAAPAWDDRAIVDGFPAGLGIKEVTGALSAVGFSSPPSWMRPYATLSNGEQFRVDLARTLTEAPDLAVVDEFTSVVDRTVAQIGSAAVAKWVRRSGKQIVAAACHYDIVDWLQPDWIYDLGGAGFSWRSVQPRPRIRVSIERCPRSWWDVFHRHHYLTGTLQGQSKCYLARVNGTPAAFGAVVQFPHPTAKNIWRLHRTVTLPDFQGVGLGNAFSEYLASLYKASGKRCRSVTSHPAMVRHRARSPLWKMDRPPGQCRSSNKNPVEVKSTGRMTSSFEYVGPRASAADVAALRPVTHIDF